MKRSAGLLLYRQMDGELEVLLVHPGGPFWAKKDLGAWSLPKGEYAEDEDALAAALREFAEETGITPSGNSVELGSVKQAGGKVVRAWAMQGDFDPSNLKSNFFEMEWPPRSGRTQPFPEVDRAEWFSLNEAERRILKGQQPFLRALAKYFESAAERRHDR